MTDKRYYVQTNAAGYVVSITNEPLLVGLFGGKDHKEVDEQTANAIEALRASGQPVSIDSLFPKKERIIAFKKSLEN